MALHVAEHAETDFLYSDDDKIDVQGTRFGPQFKPDWSPELLLSYMYLGHLIVVRRELFERLGGARSEFDGSQDYDLAPAGDGAGTARGAHPADSLPLAGDPRLDGRLGGRQAREASRPAARPSTRPCGAAASPAT